MHRSRLEMTRVPRFDLSGAYSADVLCHQLVGNLEEYMLLDYESGD